MEKYKKVVIVIIIVLIIMIGVMLSLMLIIKENESKNEIQNEQTNTAVYERKKYEGYEFQMINVDTATSARLYLEDIKTDLLYNIEEAYEKLNIDYKQAKFPTLERFQEYVEENRDRISSITISSYQRFPREDGKNGYQLVAIDTNNNYYIFNVTAVMQYDVLLDVYTVDIPMFIEQYNSATDAEKAALNLQKVFSAINNKDYQYVYNKLDSTFKQNNFPTLADFETYAENTFYDNNSVGYTNYQTSGNLHIFELNITDKSNPTSSAITKNFIMQLLDGTDFVMSFSV